LNHSSFALPKIIGIHLLLELRWDAEIKPLQAGAEGRIIYLEELLLQKGHLLKPSSVLGEVLISLKPRILSCQFPWLLGNIITIVEAQIFVIFDMILEEPLLPTYIHVYQYLVIEGGTKKDTTLESFCETFSYLLFWDPRKLPLDKRSLELSFTKWIDTPDPTTVVRVTKTRHKQNIVSCIGSENWCISHSTSQEFKLPNAEYLDEGFINRLIKCLEEAHDRIDTFALDKSLCKRLSQLHPKPVLKQELSFVQHLWDLRRVKKNLNLFSLEYSRLGSCVTRICLHCKSDVLPENSGCSGCGYAEYCSPICRANNILTHERLCRSANS
jgi:hypothetical protein